MNAEIRAVLISSATSIRKLADQIEEATGTTGLIYAYGLLSMKLNHLIRIIEGLAQAELRETDDSR